MVETRPLVTFTSLKMGLDRQGHWCETAELAGRCLYQDTTPWAQSFSIPSIASGSMQVAAPVTGVFLLDN